MKKGKLYLIPLPLAEGDWANSLPALVLPLLSRLQYFIVESEKISRRFLKQVNREIQIDQLQFSLLNEHTQTQDYSSYLQAALAGHDIGLLSDAGCPGVADPGAEVVAAAHRLGIQPVPITGPSSILLTLMGSGFNGQKFAFQGYLPVDKNERRRVIQELELESRKKKQTQLFIETPYRNEQLFDALLQHAQPNSWLCIGANLTGENELLESRTINEWRNNRPNLHKIPAVFALYASQR